MLNHGITAGGIDNRQLGAGIGDYIENHIFPGGELSHVSHVCASLARGGLELLDAENLRPHHARTLWDWSEALERQLERARELTDESRVRAYRMYLAGSAMSFEQGWLSLYQLLAARADGSVQGRSPRGAQSLASTATASAPSDRGAGPIQAFFLHWTNAARGHAALRAACPRACRHRSPARAPHPCQSARPGLAPGRWRGPDRRPRRWTARRRPTTRPPVLPAAGPSWPSVRIAAAHDGPRWGAAGVYQGLAARELSCINSRLASAAASMSMVWGKGPMPPAGCPRGAWQQGRSPAIGPGSGRVENRQRTHPASDQEPCVSSRRLTAACAAPGRAPAIRAQR